MVSLEEGGDAGDDVDKYGALAWAPVPGSTVFWPVEVLDPFDMPVRHQHCSLVCNGGCCVCAGAFCFGA